MVNAFRDRLYRRMWRRAVDARPFSAIHGGTPILPARSWGFERMWSYCGTKGRQNSRPVTATTICISTVRYGKSCLRKRTEKERHGDFALLPPYPFEKSGARSLTAGCVDSVWALQARSMASAMIRVATLTTAKVSEAATTAAARKLLRGLGDRVRMERRTLRRRREGRWVTIYVGVRRCRVASRCSASSRLMQHHHRNKPYPPVDGNLQCSADPCKFTLYNVKTCCIV